MENLSRRINQMQELLKDKDGDTLAMKAKFLSDIVREAHDEVFKTVIDKDAHKGGEIVFEDVWDIVLISISVNFWETIRKLGYFSPFKDNELISIINKSCAANFTALINYYESRQIIQ